MALILSLIIVLVITRIGMLLIEKANDSDNPIWGFLVLLYVIILASTPLIN